MLEAFSAEALKIRHHKATWFLVWVYPILFTVLFTIGVGYEYSQADNPPQPMPLMEWLEDTLIPWMIPAQTIGRYLIAAFVAVVFAGEYGWNTWKLVVPHRSRAALIAAKYGVVLMLFAITFAMTAVIAIIGAFAELPATGQLLPTNLTAERMAQLHATYAAAGIAPLLVTVGYASLAAILTRSTIAALVISIVALTFEELIFKLGPVIATKFPAVTDILYPALPGYHLANISEWITEGVALQPKFPDGVYSLPLATSVAVIAAWLAALFGAAFLAFRRQDIN